ncbi:hypothetical protein JSO60_06455 [Riemerella anatipestifer]|uniref:hypothetical protein n=1 Tax=Riemerella anatipestifer TaxID=34085 RepID=UPI0030C2C50F
MKKENNTKISKQFKLKEIFRIIDKYEVSNYEISKNTGVSEAGLGSITNGETKNPRELTVNSIYNYLVEKYESSQGEMLKSSEETPIKGEGVKVILDAEIKRTPSEGTPYYDVDFAGGWNSDEIFSLGNPSFYIQSPDFRRAEFATNLVGNSISKIIPSGAIVGFRQVEDWKTYFLTNELYGIITKNEMRTVKRVKRKKGDPNTLVLIPDPLEVHSGYEPEELPIDFVSKMFQVVAWAMYERLAM